MKVVNRVWSAVEVYVQAISFLALVLCIFTFSAPKAEAAGALTGAQIQAITNLLSSFGAEQKVIDNVQLALHGASKEDLIQAMRPSADGTANSSAPHSVLPAQLSASACAIFNRTLARGSVGDDVAKLQELLKRNGDFTEASTSNFFGPKTEAALKQWQIHMNIASSSGSDDPQASGLGQAGPRTRELLSRACGDTTNNSNEHGTTTAGWIQSSAGTTTPLCILRADKSKVDVGQSVTLRWESKNATYAGSATGEHMAPNGSVTVTATETAVYVKKVYGPGGEGQCQTTVEVTGSQGTPTTKIVFNNVGGYFSQLLSQMQLGAVVIGETYAGFLSQGE